MGAGRFPPPLTMFLLFGLLLALLLPALVSITLVSMMAGTKPLITRLPRGGLEFKRLPTDISQFIANQGLSQTETLQFRSTAIALYAEPPGPPPERSFVVMLTNNKFVAEFDTHFTDEISLTTTRGTHAFSLPRPLGAYIQGFTKLTLEQLWAKHLEAELFLLDQVKIPVASDMAGVSANTVMERMERDLRKQGACIRAVPLYWLKAIYWFYWTRFRMVNKTVAQQLAA